MDASKEMMNFRVEMRDKRRDRKRLRSERITLWKPACGPAMMHHRTLDIGVSIAVSGPDSRLHDVDSMNCTCVVSSRPRDWAIPL